MVKKKRWLIISSGAILIFVGGGIIFWRSKTSPSLVSPVGQETRETEAELAVWEDPAGFKFSYPSNLALDPHEEDQENYAHLELTSSEHPGRIIIWVKETEYSEIEDWAAQEVGQNGQVFESELAGEPAKKVAYLDPEKLITAAIDVDALVLLEMFPDPEGYWQGIYNQILNSFTFIPLEGEEETATAPGPWQGSGGAGGIIEEPEEVIE